eukprot:jgi/Tetstr1/421696/TSEL_012634.t1
MDNTRLPDDLYNSEGCGGGNAASSTTNTASLTALVQRMLLRLDELNSRTSSIQQPPPQKPIPATPADGLEVDDEEGDPSPGFPAKSLGHVAFIDPRDWIDNLLRAYAESMPPVGLTNPGLWNDEWGRYVTDEKKHAARDNSRAAAAEGDSGGGSNGNIRTKEQERAKHADRATKERADKNKVKDKIKGKPQPGNPARKSATPQTEELN